MGQAVLGLDISLTSTGICLCTRSVQVWWTEENKNSLSVIAYASQLAESISEKITREADDKSAIFIEGYAFSRFGKGSGKVADRAEITGIIKWLFRRFPQYHVSPGTIKKWLTGSGKGDKKEMILPMFKRHGLSYGKEGDFKNDDELDAWVLADFGYHVLSPESEAKRKLLKYESDMLVKFRKESSII